MKLSKILSLAFLGMLMLAAFGSFQAAQAETTILLVKKDAFGSFDKSWDWTINKTGSETSLTLSAGQQHPVNYTVRVEADGRRAGQ